MAVRFFARPAAYRNYQSLERRLCGGTDRLQTARSGRFLPSETGEEYKGNIDKAKPE
jgi:hypothetical protein